MSLVTTPAPMKLLFIDLKLHLSQVKQMLCQVSNNASLTWIDIMRTNQKTKGRFLVEIPRWKILACAEIQTPAFWQNLFWGNSVLTGFSYFHDFTQFWEASTLGYRLAEVAIKLLDTQSWLSTNVCLRCLLTMDRKTTKIKWFFNFSNLRIQF